MHLSVHLLTILVHLVHGKKFYLILPEAARNLTNVTFYKVGLIIDERLQDLQGTITAMGFAEARIRREKVIPLNVQFE